MMSGSDTAPLVQAQADVLVLDYLAALWAATDDLEPELRDELMAAVADFIAVRRQGQGGSMDDAAPILQRLGPPASLAAAARRGRMPAHLRRLAVPAPAPASSGADYAALALLTAGSVILPGAGPLAGLVLTTTSPRWTPGVKAAAWVLAAGPMLIAMVVVLGSVMFGAGPEGLFLAYALMVIGGFLAAITLLPGLTTRRPPHRS
ncbi:hypothetical protein GCM10010435_80230 [Winogradskya consettensis]|uniref:Uncharacterized protein n=2 Tax=Winogradskya consettensis TaxID=113560 RepID=A0A919VSL6_9ACTN|nr:hypothetical protein Aco04nite_54750 [Actinoplanes consettensis]